MVVISSRFTVLATLCAVASVSYTPLNANAVVVEARHSDKKIAASLPAHGDARLTKQPVIPLPHKLSKTATKGAVVEHGRIHKNKKKQREESVAPSLVDQSIRLVQFPVKAPHSLYQRHHDDDDCPDKVIVNGDRDHVHLSCHHDHHDDHHDHDHDEVIVNGDRDHVHVRGRNLQSRSPRHARPLLQRRNDTADATSGSNAAEGTVEVQGLDSSTGQPKSYGEFLAENRGDHYEIRVSKNNHTTFRMVETTSASQSNDPKSGVFLQANIPDISSRLCCTYDANPSSSAPMRLDTCRVDGSGDGHSSQKFGYDPATGRLKLIWAGPSNQTSSTQASNSTATRSDESQNTTGSGNVSIIWRPTAQNATARTEAASGGIQTQTVTVTVTAGPESTSAAREASTAMGDSTISPAPTSSISSALDSGSSSQSTPTSSPTSMTQNSTSGPVTSTPSGLKIEVAPGDSTTTSSTIESSSRAAGANPTPSDSVVATSWGAAWGMPVREGEVIDAVLEPKYVQGGMD